MHNMHMVAGGAPAARAPEVQVWSMSTPVRCQVDTSSSSPASRHLLLQVLLLTVLFRVRTGPEHVLVQRPQM